MNDRIRQLLPTLGLVAAAALVVVLSLKLRDLRERYSRLYDRATYPYAGMFVPTFQASTLAGEPVTVGGSPVSAKERQVLFVFTTRCQYCKASLPAWRELAARLDTMRSPRVRVYGISLDSTEVTRKYVAQNRLPFPVVEFPEKKLAAIYRTQAVPVTVVLDEDGRMLHSHLGQISDRKSIDSVLAMVRWQPPAPKAAPARARTAAR